MAFESWRGYGSVYEPAPPDLHKELERVRQERFAIERAAGLVTSGALESINARRKALEHHSEVARIRNENIRAAASAAARVRPVHSDPEHIAAAARFATAKSLYMQTVHQLLPEWLKKSQECNDECETYETCEQEWALETQGRCSATHTTVNSTGYHFPPARRAIHTIAKKPMVRSKAHISAPVKLYSVFIDD